MDISFKSNTPVCVGKKFFNAKYDDMDKYSKSLVTTKGKIGGTNRRNC